MATMFASGLLVRKSILSLRRNRMDIYSRAISFADIRWYVLSFVPMVFFWESAYHRLWVYLPFLLLISAIAICLAIESRNILLKICVAGLILLYVIGNISANLQYIQTFPRNSLGNTEEVARMILGDAQKRNIHNYNYQVLYYTPYGYGNYNLATVLYFLQEAGGYPVTFLKHGNDVERLRINTPDTDAVYLICRWDIPASEALEKCNDVFLLQNTGYSLESVAKLPIGKVFIYTKNK